MINNLITCFRPKNQEGGSREQTRCLGRIYGAMVWWLKQGNPNDWLIGSQVAAGDKCIQTMRGRMKAAIEELPEHACVDQLSQLLELSFAATKSAWSVRQGQWWIRLACQRDVSVNVATQAEATTTADSVRLLPAASPSLHAVGVVHAGVHASAEAAEPSTMLRSSAVIPDRVELHRLLIPFRNAAGAFLRVEVCI